MILLRYFLLCVFFIVGFALLDYVWGRPQDPSFLVGTFAGFVACYCFREQLNGEQPK